jgi:hypothetical protein
MEISRENNFSEKEKAAGWVGDMIYFNNKKYREEVMTFAILLTRLQKKPKNVFLF